MGIWDCMFFIGIICQCLDIFGDEEKFGIVIYFSYICIVNREMFYSMVYLSSKKKPTFLYFLTKTKVFNYEFSNQEYRSKRTGFNR